MSDQKGLTPPSEVFSDGMDSLSLRDKSLIKRSISKHHNNNFTAGYVPVHEEQLEKTGLRGRKTFAFWALVGLLFILAVGNLVLTMTILGVLRLGQGMQSLELVPEKSAIKLFGTTDLNDVYKRDGRLEGFQDYPVDISGVNGSILINLAPKNGRSINKLVMNKTGTLIKNIASFEVKNGERSVFSTKTPHFNLERNITNITSRAVHTSRVVSPISSRLDFEVGIKNTINLKGAEGSTMESSDIVLNADQDIYLKSFNGSIILEGVNGIKVNVNKIPIFAPKTNDKRNIQYKLCVCMPQGKLFKIPVTKDDARVYCDRINISQFNPCLA